ncbi:MAG: four helix bundle suffix domain-containing protein [Bacteroidaceae bacterium]|nr:four helix bundle suffix domain-containing protein [Prevotella sp.]MBR2945890.1 four helix bundle suffix domain-containing protein [Bacteroidaceae bacterium]
MQSSDFIRQKGNYEELLCYKKSMCVYDVTYYFAHKYLRRGDRTIDQMIQAARSGKQNIVEGCSASTTSSEMEIKLLNVAKASLQELLEDYKDYLRVRDLQLWKESSEKHQQARRACAAHNEPEYYQNAIKERSDETIANIAIILIRQTDYLLKRYFDRIKQDFLENGGIKEEMTRGRLQWRKEHR